LMIFEIMPTDTHEFMHDAWEAKRYLTPPERRAEVKTDDAVLAETWLAGIPAEARQEFVKDSKAPEPNEPEAGRVWRKVKLTKDVYVPLSANEIKQAEQAGQTPEVDPATEKPSFKLPEGTELLLDPKSAQERISKGEAQLTGENDKIYVRPLRDYVRLYRGSNLQIEELLRKTAVVEHQNAAVQDALQKVTSDTAYRDKEKAAAARDLDHFKAENVLISKHVASLEKAVAEAKAEVAKTLEENRDLQAQLTDLVQEAAAIINRRAPLAASER